MNNMEKNKFIEQMMLDMKTLQINVNEQQLEKFYKYMELLIEWNSKINLTAIIEPSEIIKKHFVDCATVVPYIKQSNKVIDVGTGAGFPGIPIKIINEEIDITLLDSLNKRLLFLNEVADKLNLNNIQIQHARAEDAGVNEKYREKYDIAISRAVAPLNVLVEYLLPFVKNGGKAICMKGNTVDEELKLAKNAISTLGGKIEKVDEFLLPNSDINRSIIVIEKVKSTPNKYPRKAGIPSKNPIM